MFSSPKTQWNKTTYLMKFALFCCFLGYMQLQSLVPFSLLNLSLGLSLQEYMLRWLTKKWRKEVTLVRFLQYKPWPFNYLSVLLFTCLLFATPWTATCQAFLSLTISQSLPKFMSIVSDNMKLQINLQNTDWEDICLEYFSLIIWQRMISLGTQRIST